MNQHTTGKVYKDLQIGNESVSSNECWENTEEIEHSNITVIFEDPEIGEEQVTSNECYGEEDENGLA